MGNIITVDEYRKRLIEFYKYKYDENTYALREKIINELYTDEYLEKIIDETVFCYEYLVDLFKMSPREYNDKVFISIDIEDKSLSLSNGCIGGWASDILYTFYKDNEYYFISSYILGLLLPDCDIYIHENVIEKMVEEDIGSFFLEKKLCIKCSKDKYQSIIYSEEAAKKVLVNKE